MNFDFSMTAQIASIFFAGFLFAAYFWKTETPKTPKFYFALVALALIASNLASMPVDWSPPQRTPVIGGTLLLLMALTGASRLYRMAKAPRDTQALQ